MDRKLPKPSRLTFIFYAAFAASFVQDGYTSPEFYRWAVGELFQAALSFFILATFVTVLLSASIRSLRQRRFPWAHAISACGALVMAEVVWRYGVNSLPGMGFKDVAIALDLAKPIVLVLGLAAIFSERSSRRRRSTSPATV